MVMAFVNLEYQHIVWNFILILSPFFPTDDLEMVKLSNLKSVRIGVMVEVVECCINLFVLLLSQQPSKSHSPLTV
jgi:formate/nitrite transporter FocA (FNT family)